MIDTRFSAGFQALSGAVDTAQFGMYMMGVRRGKRESEARNKTGAKFPGHDLSRRKGFCAGALAQNRCNEYNALYQV